MAPFEKDHTTCLADTLEHFLDGIRMMTRYYHELLVDQQPAAPSRSTLDFWANDPVGGD